MIRCLDACSDDFRMLSDATSVEQGSLDANCGSGTGCGNGSLGDGSDGHCDGGDDGSDALGRWKFYKELDPQMA